MNVRLIRFASVNVVGWLVLTGCAHLSLETAGIARRAPAATAVGLGTGEPVGPAANVLAKHDATERQQQVAEERARLAYQDMSPERKARLTRNRYIVVPTVRERNSQGAKSVMIYDTET